MQPKEIITILQQLADGVDPITGEVFPDDSPYQHPKIIRTLFTAVRLLEQLPEREQRVRDHPLKAGKPWDQAEDSALSGAFDEGVSIAALAERHQRTRGAIQSRLVKFGKITASAGVE
jgi:hypothetical protein